MKICISQSKRKRLCKTYDLKETNYQHEDYNENNFSHWKDICVKFYKSKTLIIALTVIVLLIVFAFAGPFFIQYDYNQQVRGSENLAPFSCLSNGLENSCKIINQSKVSMHVFGTDAYGRDILVRLMYATRISLTVGIISSISVLIVGVLYGAVAGFFGGIVDDIMMRLIEIISSLPDVLIILLISVTIKPMIFNFASNNGKSFYGSIIFILGPGIISMFIAFTLLYWVPIAKILRGRIIQLKNQDFILVARALGVPGHQIIIKHLLPNCFDVIVSAMCLEISSAIFSESFLSFLGLGVAAPMTSLGSMVCEALGGMYTYPYRLIIPSVVLSFMVLAFNLLGDGLQNVLSN
jgi:oligopeptide transport system permease protein